MACCEENSTPVAVAPSTMETTDAASRVYLGYDGKHSMDQERDEIDTAL